MTTKAFYVPRAVDEAVALLREYGSDLVVMGGGTIVMEKVNDGLLFPRQAMSLKRAGLDGVRQANGYVEIGATATMETVSGLDTLPPLAQAAALLGGPAVRTMATLGGNLFAEPPYGDMGPPLLALDATVELTGPQGRRTLSLADFFEGAGEPDARVRAVDELVTALHVPRPAGRTAYLKLGRRQANTPSIVAVAVHVTLAENDTCAEAHIALNGAGPHPLRARSAEVALTGRPLDATSIAEAATAAMTDSDPPTDALATAWYRRKMVGVYVRRALELVMSS